MKKIIGLIVLVIVIVGAMTFYVNRQKRQTVVEQQVLARTYAISKMYLLARYRTDQVLVEAEKYSSYEDWNNAMNEVIGIWDGIEKDALSLEKQTEKMAFVPEFELGVNTAQAAEKSEITAIFDAAPAGKKIATLAKHLGVDAKRAAIMLRQDQDKVTADAWNDAGDTFQKLETSATVIKDGCKVAGFVGGIVLTGGVSAVAGGSVMAQSAVVISGADLVLEVSDDAAKIALGNHNNVSAIIGDARKVTEPIATILNINEIPENLATGYQKFSSAMVALEQFNSAAQEGKIVGVELPAYKPVEKFANIKKYKAPVYVSVMNNSELDVWLNEKQGLAGEFSPEEINQEFGKIVTQGATENISGEALNVEDLLTAEEAVETTKTEETSEDVLATNDMENVGGGKVELVMKPAAATNDWQAGIRNALFAGAPIKAVDGKFKASYSQAFTLGNFEGSGKITLSGTYDEKTGIISGQHYRIYEGTYKGEPRTLVYSGTFKQTIPGKGEEIKIGFNGKIEETRLDGKGKPYTTSSEGGISVIYLVK